MNNSEMENKGSLYICWPHVHMDGFVSMCSPLDLNVKHVCMPAAMTVSQHALYAKCCCCRPINKYLPVCASKQGYVISLVCVCVHVRVCVCTTV